MRHRLGPDWLVPDGRLRHRGFNYRPAGACDDGKTAQEGKELKMSETAMQTECCYRLAWESQ